MKDYRDRMNQFAYRTLRKNCEGKPDEWVRNALVMASEEMRSFITEKDQTPEGEHLSNVIAVFYALGDELTARGY